MSRVTTQFAIVVLFLALLTFAESGKAGSRRDANAGRYSSID